MLSGSDGGRLNCRSVLNGSTASVSALSDFFTAKAFGSTNTTQILVAGHVAGQVTVLVHKQVI